MANSEGLSAERLAVISARVANLAKLREVGPRNYLDLQINQLCSIAMAYDTDVPDLLAHIEHLQREVAACEHDLAREGERVADAREAVVEIEQRLAAHEVITARVAAAENYTGWSQQFNSNGKMVICPNDKFARIDRTLREQARFLMTAAEEA